MHEAIWMRNTPWQRLLVYAQAYVTTWLNSCRSSTLSLISISYICQRFKGYAWFEVQQLGSSWPMTSSPQRHRTTVYVTTWVHCRRLPTIMGASITQAENRETIYSVVKRQPLAGCSRCMSTTSPLCAPTGENWTRSLTFRCCQYLFAVYASLFTETRQTYSYRPTSHTELYHELHVGLHWKQSTVGY